MSFSIRVCFVSDLFIEIAQKVTIPTWRANIHKRDAMLGWNREGFTLLVLTSMI